MAATTRPQPVTLSARAEALTTALELLDRRRVRHAENALTYALMSAVDAGDQALVQVSGEQIDYHDQRAEALAALMQELQAMLTEETR